MKKPLFALLALVLLLVGCPSGPVDVGVEASTFTPASTVDGAVASDASAPHRLGSFNPTCTGNGYPIVVSGVQQTACATLGTGVGAWLANPTGGNLASALTTALPVSKGGTNRTALGTSLQVLRTNVGATDTEWATVSGGASAGGSGQVQTSDGAGGFTAPTNVLAGANFLSVGASPAASGSIRTASGMSIWVKNTIGNDIPIIAHDGSDSIQIGSNTAQQSSIFANTGSSYLFRANIGNTYVLSASNVNVLMGRPAVGETLESSPYSVHGKTTVATAPPFTLAAADYSKDAIMLSSATAGTVTFPTPADDAHAYYKTVINTGAGTKTLTDGGASTPTLAVNLSGHYLFDTAGVHLTGPSVAYP